MAISDRQVVAQMILPYPLDLIPEWLGVALQKFLQWRPEGTRVEIEFEGADDSLIHGVYRGTIETIARTVVTRGPYGVSESIGPFPIIKLDEPLLFRHKPVSYLIALNRYLGHGLPRILVAAATVNVHPVDDPRDMTDVLYETRIGSANLRRV